MLDWIISLAIGAVFAAGAWHANGKFDTLRKDERPHQLPWGLIMIGCIFGLFLVVVHLFNIVGVETGPENAMFGRF